MASVDSLKTVGIAVPRPLDQIFTYLVPEGADSLHIGSWVKVPFGRSEVIGFVAEEPRTLHELPPGLKRDQIKPLIHWGTPDEKIPEDVYQLCVWASKYYAQPLGELLTAACPPASLGLRSAKKEAKTIPPYSGTIRELVLSDEQASVAQSIWEKKEGESSVALLRGVTGSGKTEVYIELARRTLAEGRGVILLVPEIALSSQLHERIEAGVGETVARWHSALPDGQRRDLAHALRSGEIRVVVGARSGVFAPVKNLGLLIVDEEHDPTYKQDERVHYHARDLAIVRGRITHSRVVLGSATPSLESLERVREGKYSLHQLKNRYASGGMPTIEWVDLGHEPMVEGLQAPIAEKTLNTLRETLLRGEQAMIYLNRRGFASFLRCADCGEVSECPQCSISLTVHKRNRELRCHVCGHLEKIPDLCVKCQSLELEPIGAGTESLEDELPGLLPDVRFLRLDRDVITSTTRLDKTLAAFRQGEAQVLLGTQMLVKGHDFPKVTLVIVILADALFRYPDFRAPERALQILAQVSGRSGRSDLPGRVLIQTYQPDAPVLEVLLGKKSSDDFLEEERQLRQTLGYPPFGRMARLRIEASDRKEAVARAEALAQPLFQLAKRIENEDAKRHLDVLGPSEAFLEKANGIYRWDILLKSPDIQSLSRGVSTAKSLALQEKWPLLVDVDPYGVG